MGRKRRRNEPSGRQIIQAQQMFQNLLVSLDTAGVQRLLESRDVLAALADGRLTPRKAMASLGLPVTLASGKTVTMDFFGMRKDAAEHEILAAFRRQGMRAASVNEFRRFYEQHHEVVHDLVVRSRRSIALLANPVRLPIHRSVRTCRGFPTFSRSSDGEILRYDEYADGNWHKGYRFLGVRLDPRPDVAVIPGVSLQQIVPKVRPTA